MNRIFKSIVLLAVIILQTTILSHFTPFNVVPNYTLVTVIAICVISHDKDCVIFAALAGFLTDAFTGTPFGINILMYMYLAVLLVIVSETIYSKSAMVFAPVCFVSSFLCELFLGVTSFLLKGVEVQMLIVIKVALLVSVMNSVIFIPVYALLSRVKIEKRRKGIKYEQ